MDRTLLVTIAIIIFFGFLLLASASSFASIPVFGHPYGYFWHQLWAGFGLGLMAFTIIYFTPLPYIERLSPWIFYGSLVLLILVLFPQLGVSFGGARRWLAIGSFSFQPAEITKLSFLVFLASWFSKKPGDVVNFRKTFIPFLLFLVLIGGLIMLEPDMGTVVVIIALALAIYFAAGGSIKHISIIALVSILASILLISFSNYRLDRIQAFLNTSRDPQGVSYHIRQSLTAIATGGIFGKGLGLGRLKMSRLPEPMSDTIFSVLAEETGLVGVLLMLALFTTFFLRALKVSVRFPRVFGKLAGIGIASLIFFQMLVHVASVSGLIPFTGIPLPLVSYGGTHYLVTMASLGLLFQITKKITA